MSTVTDAWDGLAAAVRAVDGLRVYTDPGASVDPPAALVGPPELRWDAYTDGPTSARFLVVLMVPNDERAVARLLDLVLQVQPAIEGETNAVARVATVGAWRTGATDLPCYMIETEVSL